MLHCRLITKNDVESGKFTLYFLAYVDSVPESEEEKRKLCFSMPGVLELTQQVSLFAWWRVNTGKLTSVFSLHCSNWGTENDANFAYANGNKEPGRGFGHIAVLVDDINAACERFEQLNVKYIKRLTDGSMKHIAFIADPDEYWIEVRRYFPGRELAFTVICSLRSSKTPSSLVKPPSKSFVTNKQFIPSCILSTLYPSEPFQERKKRTPNSNVHEYNSVSERQHAGFDCDVSERASSTFSWFVREQAIAYSSVRINEILNHHCHSNQHTESSLCLIVYLFDEKKLKEKQGKGKNDFISRKKNFFFCFMIWFATQARTRYPGQVPIFDRVYVGASSMEKSWYLQKPLGGLYLQSSRACILVLSQVFSAESGLRFIAGTG